MRKARQRAIGTAAALALGAFAVSDAVAQEPGWTYSRLSGEGDRAAMGCARPSTPDAFACVVVRCEDDLSTGVYIHTSRPDGDVGHWLFTIDRDHRRITAVATSAPYGARVATIDPADRAWLLDGLRYGGVVYLTPDEGAVPHAGLIWLDGSHAEITQALAFCAPRVPSER